MAGIKREIASKEIEEEKRKNAIKEARDVNGAAEYALKYALLMNQSQNEELRIFYGIKAMDWLYEAKKFCPNNRDLSEFLDVDNFFNLFSKLYCFFPFIENLLPTLLRNKSIVEIDFTKDRNNKCLFFSISNRDFVTYITQTRSIKILNLSEKPYLHAFSYYEIQKLAGCLGENSSIEELHLEGQPLLDNGLAVLLNALSNNTRTKISKLNILNTGVTDAGALDLLNFLRKNTSVGTLDLISTDTTANEYELVVAQKNSNPIKGKLCISRGYYPNWVEISFISYSGALAKCSFDEEFHKIIGTSPKNMHALSSEQLKVALPKIMHEFRGTFGRIKNSLSQEFINPLKNALRKNNKEAQIAYIKGAMCGFFKKIDIPAELGIKTGEYLTKQDGINLALTTKVAAKNAIEEEAKVYLGKL